MVFWVQKGTTLVIVGFDQLARLDYKKIFNLKVKPATILVVRPIAITYGCIIR